MKHIGVHKKRLNKYNPREVAFSEAWQHENEGRQNSSRLQDLMIEVSDEPKDGFHKRRSMIMSRGYDFVKIHHKITQRDAEIVATVIQWLGSNVGMSFLAAALKECGKKIVNIEKPREDIG
ncbi:MAG: hypothetical protein C0415_05980 [Thermodesulfovibrio sp.]|nr:hypothetical protein [Thermodesulfovibrio sp.]